MGIKSLSFIFLGHAESKLCETEVSSALREIPDYKFPPFNTF